MRETRKKARVDYRDVNYNVVDYTEMDNNNEVQASGIMQDEGKTSSTVKDARRKAESEKKSRSKEKRGSTEKRDDSKRVDNRKDMVKEGNKEDLKHGRGKTSVNKKRKSGVKEKDCGKEEKEKKTNEKNIEEDQIGLEAGHSGQAGVTKKHQKFIFEYWVVAQKSYLNMGDLKKSVFAYLKFDICIPKSLYLHTK